MPPPSDSEWQTPTWVRYPEHLPVKEKEWNEVIAATGVRGAKSKYGPHPQINERHIRKLELAVVITAIRDPRSFHCGELPRPYDDVRAFWGKVDRIIGACDGQETQYMYVQYDRDGSIHGRPMTYELLLTKGMSHHA